MLSNHFGRKIEDSVLQIGKLDERGSLHQFSISAGRLFKVTVGIENQYRVLEHPRPLLRRILKDRRVDSRLTLVCPCRFQEILKGAIQSDTLRALFDGKCPILLKFAQRLWQRFDR